MVNDKKSIITSSINQIILPKIDIISADTYKSLIRPHQELASTIAKLAGEMREATKIVQNVIYDLRKTINQVIPDIQHVAKFANRMMQYHESEKDAFLASGWFIGPSLNQVRYNYFASAIHSTEKSRNGKMTTLMKKLYSENNWSYLQDTINKWSSHRFFTKNRMKTIQDAYENHQHKKYSVAIPALLPIVEGICGDYCKEQKLKIGSSQTKQKATEVLAALNAKGEKYVAELLTEYMLHQLYIKSDKIQNSSYKNKKYLNRHTILHGSQTGYADCARSLRCFLLLDVLTCYRC